MTGYIVCDEPRGLACWLSLSLPYGYPKWVHQINEATVLSYANAHAWADAFGTRVNGENRARVVPTHRAVATAKAMIERVEEAAMQAQQAAMVDMCWTGDDS